MIKSLSSSRFALPRALALIGTSLIALGQAGIAAAQTAPQSASAGTATDPGEILVTARRQVESLQKVPDSVTVFTAKTLEDARVRRLDDFVAMTPGFEIHDGESAGVFRMSIRGITQTNQGDAPVTMVVDGVTLPYANSFGKALFDVQQIEVLKGPQGSLYGQNAIGGAVLVTTQQATNDFSARLTGSLGTREHRELTAVVSGPVVQDKVLFRVSGYLSHDGGDMSYAYFPKKKTSVERRQALRGDLTFKLTDNFTAVIGADVGHSFYGALPLIIRTLSAGSGIPNVTTDQLNQTIRLNRPNQTSPDLPRTKQNYWDVSAKLDWDLGAVTATSVTAYQEVNEREVQDLDVSYIPFVYGHLNNLISAFSEELRLSSNSDGPFHWVVGGYMLKVNRHYDIDPAFINVTLLTTGNTDPAAAVYVPFSQTLQQQDLDSYALFGQAEWDVTDKLQLTFGGRYDYDPRENLVTGFTLAGPNAPLRQKRTFKQFQPKASIRYSFSSDANVYATVARGFRAGGFNSGANANVLPAFAPEKTTAYEIGTKLALLDRRVNISAAAFYTDYKNQQLSLVSVGAGGVSQDNFTVDKTRIQGVEFNMQARPVTGVQLEFGYAYTDGKIKKFGASLTGSAFNPAAYVGNKVPLTSKYTLNGAAQFTQPLTDTIDGVARIDVERKGSLYWEPDNNAKRKPFTLVNMSAGIRTEMWELRAFGDNVFGKRYDSLFFDNLFVGAPGGFNFAYVSRASRYGVEATVRF
nr:TonB-dependent receptor [Sphingomonas sp. Y57]